MISYEKLQNIFEQDAESTLRLTSDKDASNKINKIVKPQGIIIQDTWNNFVFPIQPMPKIDTYNFDLPLVTKRFREIYLNFPSLFLPWHYIVEMIGDLYYIFQTRPLDTKFPLNNQEVLDRKHDFQDDVTKTFFENKIFQIENMIHICIIGDSNLDVYSNKLYKLIGLTCIGPMYRDMRISSSVDTSVFGFNIGTKFNMNTLTKFSKK